jgi:hypothetical protein
MERRQDSRQRPLDRISSLRIWLRSLAKPRLGVDRRKSERRVRQDRRQLGRRGVLTQEEISDLLS